MKADWVKKKNRPTCPETAGQSVHLCVVRSDRNTVEKYILQMQLKNAALRAPRQLGGMGVCCAVRLAAS